MTTACCDARSRLRHVKDVLYAFVEVHPLMSSTDMTLWTSSNIGNIVGIAKLLVASNMLIDKQCCLMKVEEQHSLLQRCKTASSVASSGKDGPCSHMPWLPTCTSPGRC